MVFSRRNTTKYGWRGVQPMLYTKTVALWKTSSYLQGSSPSLAFPRECGHPAATSHPRLLHLVLLMLWASQPLP